jgi:hypothetical protein
MKRHCSFVLLLLALGISNAAFAGDVVITDKAKTLFSAGVNYLTDPSGAKYELAYRQFKAAYQESPSPKILGNLGLCALNLERDEEAIASYTEYLAYLKKLPEDKANPTETRRVEIDLNTLKTSLAHVTIKTNEPGVMIIDTRNGSKGDKIVNRYGPFKDKKEITLGIHPGQHNIAVRLKGYKADAWDVDVGPASNQSNEFVLKPSTETKTPPDGTNTSSPPPPPPPPIKTRPTPTIVYVGLAATGAFAVGAGVTGLLALGKRSDYNSKNNGANPSTAQSLRDSGNTLNLVTDILLGGTLVAGGLTAYFYFTRPEETAPANQSRFLITPSATPGGGGLVATGTF